MNRSNNSQIERIKPVFAYIEQHLDDELSLQTLADVACCSKYHFHRLFSVAASMPTLKYVQLQRLKRAGYQLAFREQFKVIDIALEAGFENAESFSRAFKKVFDQAPLTFRKQPNWDSWQAKFELSPYLRAIAMQQTPTVEIIEFPETQVAAFEHQGPANTVMNSVRSFIQWRKRNKLSPQTSQTYNIFYHDPQSVLPDDYRMDICVTTNNPVESNPEGVVAKSLAGGRCAKLRHIGSDALLQSKIHWLYRDWLNESGETLRDFPLFVHRVTLFPDVPEHKMICDIYLPLHSGVPDHSRNC